jgi:methionyl-tRNA formyltransferase
MKFVFFGTPEPAVEILDSLNEAGLVPALIVTNPDKPAGRNLKLTPSPVKEWALRHDIPVLQPEKLTDTVFLYKLKAKSYQLFIVVAYGSILPSELLRIPKRGALNVHYSLLPKYRGPSPVESQILADDRETGVSILLLDEEMDHGAIVAQKAVQITPWPPTAEELRKKYNEEAGKLLVDILPDWVDGKIEAKPQEHAKATYARKIAKEDVLITLEDDAYKNYLKIQALIAWGPHFLAEKQSAGGARKIRVRIASAQFKDGKLLITRVVPEGKKEMTYDDFLRGLRR